jgi:hypothetical protein
MLSQLKNTKELLKNKENYDPRKLDDKILLDDHRISHAWWSQVLKGEKIKNWSKEDIYNAHELIVQEMLKRGMKHDSPLQKENYDQPYPAWRRDSEKTDNGPFILKDVLSVFEDDIMISEDFVSIVGGLCAHGATKGDIDVLIKAPEPSDEGSPEGMATKFRISRAMAKLNIPEEKIQFLYDDFHGPFTNHVPLFDLVLKLKPKVLHEMQQSIVENNTKSVIPLKFVIQPKPVHGRYKEEIYSPETVLNVIKKLPHWKDKVSSGIYVEKKFDGVRCQVHKVGKEIRIWTEEKGDVTKKLPTLSKQFLEIKKDFVAEFELEHWMDNEHQSRSDVAGMLHMNIISPHEPMLIANLYDCMWFDGKDIHSLSFSERINFLSKLGSSKNIHQSKKVLAKTEEDIRNAVISFSKENGSEGAMLKLPSYKYPLSYNTNEMMKFKNEFRIKVEVVQKNKVKGSNSFNYLTAIPGSNGEKIPTGKTYNTNIDVEVGKALEVVFVNLNKYLDPNSGNVWYNFWSPRVVGKADTVDPKKTAEDLVKRSHGEISKKSFPVRYESVLDLDLIDEFQEMCLKEESEEFDFSLLNNWIHGKDLIPEKIFRSELELMRNSEGYIIRKNLNESSLIILRDENNLQKENIMVELNNG